MGLVIEFDELFSDINSDRNVFFGSFLERFMSRTECVQYFGPDFEALEISPSTVAAIISQQMQPPERPMGIKFMKVSFDDNLIAMDSCNEILADVDYGIDGRAEWFAEAEEDTPIEWLTYHPDPKLVSRHLPLIHTADGSKMFHAQHLYQVLRAIFDIPYSWTFFGIYH